MALPCLEAQYASTLLSLASCQAESRLAPFFPQGVRGGYELTEPGVLLPASLSPLAPPAQQLPPMSAFDAQQAAQGLADSAAVLAAVTAAWQVRHAGVDFACSSAQRALPQVAQLAPHPRA